MRQVAASRSHTIAFRPATIACSLAAPASAATRAACASSAGVHGRTPVGDVQDAAPDEVAFLAGQPEQRHLAGHQGAVDPAEGPVETGPLTGECTGDVLVGRRGRGPAVRLPWRAQVHRPDVEQLLAGQAEQLLGGLVDRHETAARHVEDHDRVRGVLHQSDVALQVDLDVLARAPPALAIVRRRPVPIVHGHHLNLSSDTETLVGAPIRRRGGSMSGPSVGSSRRARAPMRQTGVE
jgi:hypothetical protein